MEKLWWKIGEAKGPSNTRWLVYRTTGAPTRYKARLQESGGAGGIEGSHATLTDVLASFSLIDYAGVTQ